MKYRIINCESTNRASTETASAGQKGTVGQEVRSPVLSPEDFVPNGHERVGAKGTDEYEQQQVQTHHDGKMVPEEPGGAARASEQRQRR